MTEANVSSYWISSKSLYITLNANGDPNYIVGNTMAGSQILCYMRGIDGLDYDAGHNYRRWPLSCSPTFFNSNTAKYVYVAIPRPGNPYNMAYVVFPSERLDIYGKNEAGTQMGSTDYYYVWLQGIISATNAGVTQERYWQQEIQTGTLSSDEAIDAGGDHTWWQYNAISDTVTFLKQIVMSATSWFSNIRLGGVNNNLNGVAKADTPDYYIDSDTLVATPAYLHENYLSKKKEDAAQEQIGFLKGLWVKALGLFGIDADGNGEFNNVNADGNVSVNGNVGVKGFINALTGIFKTLKSGNYTQGDLTGTGYQLTADDGTGASQLVVDNIVARMKFIANILEVRKLTAMAGNYVFSPAASIIEEVDYFDSGGELIGYVYMKQPWILRNAPTFLKRAISNIGIFSTQRWVRVNLTDSDMSSAEFFRCWLKADDGSTQTINTWRVGMLARCQTFDASQIEGGTQEGTYSEAGETWTGKNVTNKLYWRAVVGTGNSNGYSGPSEVLKDGKLHNYIDLANYSWFNQQDVEVPLYYPNASGTTCDIPSAGDHIVCYGDWKNTDTSNFVTIETVGSDAPAVKEFMGVGCTNGQTIDWNLDDKMKTRISPKAGDRFVAPNFIIEIDGEQYDLYTTLKADINGVEIRVGSLEGGKNLLKNVLSGEGWSSNGVSALVKDYGIYGYYTGGSAWSLKSPVISIELEADTEYTVSYYGGGGTIEVYSTANVKLATVSTSNVSGDTIEVDNVTKYRQKATFSLETKQSIYLLLKITGTNPSQDPVYYPQLELGDTPTDFVADSKQTASLIKQTADDITLSVQQTYATKSELQIAADGITSTVEDMAGSGKNLLTGSEDYISTNKLKHKSKEKDGYIEYPPNNNGVKIYSAYDLVAGKEYVLQCKSDGTLADRHWDDTGVDPTALYYTVWMRYFGDDSHNFCFTSANRGGTKTDGSLWWKFTPEISGTYYFRTNSYSDGSTEVTINFWDIMCEMGSTASSWVAPKRDTTKSVVTQTASEYDVSIRNALGETGINIQGSNRTIDITAAKVQIGNDQTATVFEGGKIKANFLEVDTIMSEGDGIYTNIQPGQFSLGVIENSVRQTAFDLAVDENGNAVLRYYDKNGNLVGVIDSSFFNSEAIGNTWNPVRLKKVNNSTGLNEPTYASVRTIVKNSLLPVQTAYKFSEGYTKSGTGQQIVKTYNVSQNQSPSQFNNLYLDAQYTTDQLRAALIGTPSDTYFTDGTYVAENAIPMSEISYQSEEPKFFYQLYIISSGVYFFGRSAYAQPGDDVEA